MKLRLDGTMFLSNSFWVHRVMYGYDFYMPVHCVLAEATEFTAANGELSPLLQLAGSKSNLDSNSRN